MEHNKPLNTNETRQDGTEGHFLNWQDCDNTTFFWSRCLGKSGKKWENNGSGLLSTTREIPDKYQIMKLVPDISAFKGIFKLMYKLSPLLGFKLGVPAPEAHANPEIPTCQDCSCFFEKL